MAKMTYWPFRYGVAVLAVATAIGFLLIPGIGKGLGSVLFLAVLVSAWYGGLGPGLLATTLVAAVAAPGLASSSSRTSPRGVSCRSSSSRAVVC